MYKFILLSILLAAASACQYAPGTTTTTTTSSTTTVSGSGDSEASSVSDRSLVRSSLERAMTNGDIPPAILFNFLKEHPEYQQKFTAFADVPQDKLMKNGNFLSQAFTIMAGLNLAISSLGRNDLLAIVEMNHLGVTHFELGVTQAMFEQFGRVIISVLDEKLALSDEEERAWQNCLAELINGVSKSLKPPQDIGNPLTKLTIREIKGVKFSWENIRAQRNAIVSKIFLTMFSNNAKLQSKFDGFKDIPLGDLASNAAFNEQVALVADRLDSMIGVLNTPLQLVGQVRYMAFSHKPRGVGRQEFQDFSDLLIQEVNSMGVTVDDLKSWKGVLSTMIRNIAKIQGI